MKEQKESFTVRYNEHSNWIESEGGMAVGGGRGRRVRLCDSERGNDTPLFPLKCLACR